MPKPKITNKYSSENIVVLTACFFGLIQQTIFNQGMDAAVAILNRIKKLYPHTFVELQHHGKEEDDEIVKQLLELAEKTKYQTGWNVSVGTSIQSFPSVDPRPLSRIHSRALSNFRFSTFRKSSLRLPLLVGFACVHPLNLSKSRLELLVSIKLPGFLLIKASSLLKPFSFLVAFVKTREDSSG